MFEEWWTALRLPVAVVNVVGTTDGAWLSQDDTGEIDDGLSDGDQEKIFTWKFACTT